MPELCEICLKNKSDASRMLAILAEKGLVRKEGKHKSGYGGTVQLTEAGMEAARHVRQRASRAVEVAGKDLTPTQREEFYKALESITENLRTLFHEGIPE